MTPDQIRLALALNRVNFFPGIRIKKFAQDMAVLAIQPKPRPITPAQAEYLRTAVIRYRKTLPAEVVELAEQMAPELQGSPTTLPT